MTQNQTDSNSEQSLATATGTIRGTKAHRAVKTIHKEYNKLNGFEAMLHIVNRYRFVLYPFIFLSIAGSTYSFYNDFIKAIPMLSDTINLFLALLFAVMLEIVRDGSLIAIFNSKMRLPSRITVVLIFIAVTSYMYNAHLKAIDVIEAKAIEYTLANQSTATVTSSNPAYRVALEELQQLKQDLRDKRAEKTDSLIANSTSVHTKKRKDALSRIEKIDNQVEKIKADIKAKNKEIISFQNSNIEKVENSQKLISNILLATLILVESLAMLGAVIKFIHADNASKEIAKHSEIVEEYVEISEQMRQDNEELTKNLSNTVKAQSESNQAVMNLVTEDLKQGSKQNIEFIKAIAQNKNEMMQQMNDILVMVAQTGAIAQMPQPQSTPISAPTTRKIGFQAQSKEQMIQALYKHGNVNGGDKLASKNNVVNIKKRQENQKLTDFYKELVDIGIIENRGMGRNGGYYAVADYQTALNSISRHESI